MMHKIMGFRDHGNVLGKETSVKKNPGNIREFEIRNFVDWNSFFAKSWILILKIFWEAHPSYINSLGLNGRVYIFLILGGGG